MSGFAKTGRDVLRNKYKQSQLTYLVYMSPYNRVSAKLKLLILPIQSYTFA